MIADIINGKCAAARATMDFYLNRHEPGAGEAEFGGHLKVCESCRGEWTDRLSLKNKLKQAVNRDFAPARLFDAIRRQISEQQQ